MKDHRHTYSFIWIIIFFNWPFEYGDGIFKLLRWMWNLRQSMWDHKILYADRYLEDEQLSIWPLLREFKNVNMVGSWKLKFTLYFMERSHEPLHLEKRSFVLWRIMDMPTSLIWIIVFFDRPFEYGGSSKLGGYFGTNTELLCIEFCNFEHLFNLWTPVFFS
jgi:hypothetical protein